MICPAAEGGVTALLHILPQSWWHAPAWLIGNRAGLKALRAAIDAALRDGRADADVFATDGEGYGVLIRVCSDGEMAEVPYGYTDEIARDNRRVPEWLIR